jgi:hypothetical protein
LIPTFGINHEVLIAPLTSVTAVPELGALLLVGGRVGGGPRAGATVVAALMEKMTK